MPKPYPAFHPVFSPADVAVIQRMVRTPTLAYRLVQRAKLAVLLHTEPALSSVAAARRLDQHPNWVRKWRHRWAQQGFEVAALADHPRSGRPPTVSPPSPRRGSPPWPVSCPPSGISHSAAIRSRICCRW